MTRIAHFLLIVFDFHLREMHNFHARALRLQLKSKCFPNFYKKASIFPNFSRFSTFFPAIPWPFYLNSPDFSESENQVVINMEVLPRKPIYYLSVKYCCILHHPRPNKAYLTDASEWTTELWTHLYLLMFRQSAFLVLTGFLKIYITRLISPLCFFLYFFLTDS